MWILPRCDDTALWFALGPVVHASPFFFVTERLGVPSRCSASHCVFLRTQSMGTRNDVHLVAVVTTQTLASHWRALKQLEDIARGMELDDDATTYFLMKKCQELYLENQDESLPPDCSLHPPPLSIDSVLVVQNLMHVYAGRGAAAALEDPAHDMRLEPSEIREMLGFWPNMAQDDPGHTFRIALLPLHQPLGPWTTACQPIQALLYLTPQEMCISLKKSRGRVVYVILPLHATIYLSSTHYPNQDADALRILACVTPETVLIDSRPRKGLWSHRMILEVYFGFDLSSQDEIRDPIQGSMASICSLHHLWNPQTRVPPRRRVNEIHEIIHLAILPPPPFRQILMMLLRAGAARALEYRTRLARASLRRLDLGLKADPSCTIHLGQGIVRKMIEWEHLQDFLALFAAAARSDDDPKAAVEGGTRAEDVTNTGGPPPPTASSAAVPSRLDGMRQGLRLLEEAAFAISHLFKMTPRLDVISVAWNVQLNWSRRGGDDGVTIHPELHGTLYLTSREIIFHSEDSIDKFRRRLNQMHREKSDTDEGRPFGRPPEEGAAAPQRDAEPRQEPPSATKHAFFPVNLSALKTVLSRTSPSERPPQTPATDPSQPPPPAIWFCLPLSSIQGIHAVVSKQDQQPPQRIVEAFQAGCHTPSMISVDVLAPYAIFRIQRGSNPYILPLLISMWDIRGGCHRTFSCTQAQSPESEDRAAAEEPPDDTYLLGDATGDRPLPAWSPVQLRTIESFYMSRLQSHPLSTTESKFLSGADRDATPRDALRLKPVSEYARSHAVAPDCLVRDEAVLERLVYKGLPQALRGPLWYSLSGAETRQRSFGPRYYLETTQEPQAAADRDVSEAWRRQIECDLHRSCPSHPFYDTESGGVGIQRLRRVLMAFARHAPQVGYCQSMNIVASALLLHLSEEQTFYMLAVLAEQLESYWAPHMLGVKADLAVVQHFFQERWTAAAAPVDFDMAVLPWMLCLFVRHVPTALSLRLLDAIFYHLGRPGACARHVLIKASILFVLRAEHELLGHAADAFHAVSLLRRRTLEATNDDDDDAFMETLREAGPIPFWLLIHGRYVETARQLNLIMRLQRQELEQAGLGVRRDQQIGTVSNCAADDADPAPPQFDAVLLNSPSLRTPPPARRNRSFGRNLVPSAVAAAGRDDRRGPPSPTSLSGGRRRNWSLPHFAESPPLPTLVEYHACIDALHAFHKGCLVEWTAAIEAAAEEILGGAPCDPCRRPQEDPRRRLQHRLSVYSHYLRDMRRQRGSRRRGRQLLVPLSVAPTPEAIRPRDALWRAVETAMAHHAGPAPWPPLQAGGLAPRALFRLFRLRFPWWRMSPWLQLDAGDTRAVQAAWEAAKPALFRFTGARDHMSFQQLWKLLKAIERPNLRRILLVHFHIHAEADGGREIRSLAALQAATAFAYVNVVYAELLRLAPESAQAIVFQMDDRFSDLKESYQVDFYRGALVGLLAANARLTANRYLCFSEQRVERASRRIFRAWCKPSCLEKAASAAPPPIDANAAPLGS